MDLTLTEFLKEDFDHYRCHFSDGTVQNMVAQQKCVIYAIQRTRLPGEHLLGNLRNKTARGNCTTAEGRGTSLVGEIPSQPAL